MILLQIVQVTLLKVVLVFHKEKKLIAKKDVSKP